MSTKFTYVFGLTPDTDREILLNLHGKQLFTACSVNRYIYSLCDSVFWKRKFMKHYKASLGSVQAVNYRTAYNEMYIRNIEAQLIWVAKTYREGHDLTGVLLDRGANIHCWNDSALRLAAGNGHITTVELLLDRGANIHVENDYVLRYAAENGHKDIVELLLNRGTNIHDWGDYALQFAATNGHTKKLELLLDRDA